MKTYNKYVKESALDPTQDELSPDIWDKNKKMKLEVKEQIMSIYEEFANQINLDLEIHKIILVGSITGYNYADDTDIDVHIEYKTDDKEKIKRLRDIAPSEELLDGTEHPINYYFMYKDEQPESHYRGIYDILNDKWLKEDVKYNVDANDFYQKAITQAVSWGRKFMLDIDELRRDMMEIKIYQHFLELETSSIDKAGIEDQIERKKQEIKADYDVLVMNPHVLRAFRKEPYDTDGEDKFDSLTFPKNTPKEAEYSLNNVVFKILEKFKYFEMAAKMKDKCKEEFPELLNLDKEK